ncbi:MAG: DUF3347 domain-containing protein [Chitinophagaceae bacterium]
MKNIFLATALTLISVVAFGQHDHSSHQKQTSTSKEATTNKTTLSEHSQKQLLQLLASYYNIKNALVAGDATSAASNADEFLKTVNTVDYKVISEGNSHILAKDAGRISTTKDLKKQREYFANFSSNMASVAKALKLGDQPVYLQYCPMKKASWLSSEKEIRNPYYGSSMLTCGEVTETL